MATRLVAVAEVSGIDPPDSPGDSASEQRKPGQGEFERLKAENAALKHRLEAAETVARERQARIDDLLVALRMLPAAWAERKQVARKRSAPRVRWKSGTAAQRSRMRSIRAG